MNGNIRTQAAHAPPAPRRRRGWLVVALLLFLLAAGATGGVWWWRIRAASADQAKNLGTDSGSKPVELTTERQECSDDADPKFLEGLEFGPPVEVAFRRGLLDALADRPIPPVEVFPWQPRGLVAVLGEHRMRGSLLTASPDGKQLAINYQGSVFIRIGPVETLRESTVIACPAAVRTMTWSPTGRFLAVASDDGVVRLHDIRDLDAIPAPLAMEKVAGAGLITCLSFSADGKYLLGGDDTALQGVGWVWDVTTRKVVNRLVHIGPVVSVAFSPVADRDWTFQHLCGEPVPVRIGVISERIGATRRSREGRNRLPDALRQIGTTGKFSLHRHPKSVAYFPPSRSDKRGGRASSRTRGGMWWTRERWRVWRSQGGLNLVSG